MSEPNSRKNTATEKFYLLPNLLTTAGMFFGFYAAIASINMKFTEAAIAIFIAMIFDALDGRVARMTNTQSEFGAQYDSMADIISFGVAPALLTYNFCLASFGKYGWLATFVFVACAALRLARFNTSSSTSSTKYFQGLPSPAAAAVLASIVWLVHALEISSSFTTVIIAILTVLAGLLMVSNFRYSAFKEVEWGKNHQFFSLLAVVLLFVVVAARPAEVLFLTFLAYMMSGLIAGLTDFKLLNFSKHKDADFEPDDMNERSDLNNVDDESKGISTDHKKGSEK